MSFSSYPVREGGPRTAEEILRQALGYNQRLLEALGEEVSAVEASLAELKGTGRVLEAENEGLTAALERLT